MSGANLNKALNLQSCNAIIKVAAELEALIPDK